MNKKSKNARKKSSERLGKDEVSSSNLLSSSIETLEPQWFEGFNLFIEFVGKTLFPTILPTNS